MRIYRYAQMIRRLTRPRNIWERAESQNIGAEETALWNACWNGPEIALHMFHLESSPSRQHPKNLGELLGFSDTVNVACITLTAISTRYWLHHTEAETIVYSEVLFRPRHTGIIK